MPTKPFVPIIVIRGMLLVKKFIGCAGIVLISNGNAPAFEPRYSIPVRMLPGGLAFQNTWA